MISRMQFRSNNRPARRGVSLWEVLGCILAVGVGVWLGARYLGLDVHTLAYSALSDTEIIDQIPEEWQPAPPEGMEVPTAEELAVELRDELDSIRLDVAQLQQEKEHAQSVAELAEAYGAEAEEIETRRQNTLAFWMRLGEIRSEVDRLQNASQDVLNEQNVWKVLEVRRRAYLYGSKAVKAAMEGVVDPQAIQFANQLRSWYKHGADLYGEAMQVWQGQNVAQGPQTDQILNQARQQHDNEALLLFQKGGRLREVLIRRYQVAFPELEEPEGE